MRAIRQAIIHCSDSQLESHANVETIRQWHLERGFSDIGYHYVIDFEGNCFEGRPIHITGAHCKGQNLDSVGICLTGRDNFTEAQFDSLKILLKKLIELYEIPKIFIRPHNYYDKSKTCPNFDLSVVTDAL